MNPDNGELRKFLRGATMPGGFEDLPPELQLAARLKLNGREEAKVNVRSSTPLANWAKRRRKDKHKARIASKSRRINRGKR